MGTINLARVTFKEIICEGGDMVMRLFRLYIPEVIQTYSSEGLVDAGRIQRFNHRQR